MEYVVAIPSYQRPETLKNKTLSLLQDYDIEPERIHIFVANKKEEDNYRNNLEPESYHKIIRGKKGVKNIRNFMANYFDQGQAIFYIDDDISQLFQNYNDPKIKMRKRKQPKIIPSINSQYNRSNNYLTKLPCLKTLIEEGFKQAQEKEMDNWGIYPVENPYFMKPTSRNEDDFISTKLNYLMGGLTGVFNNREAEKRTLDDKEDYERSIKYYLKDDGVIRFNNVCARTNCYTEPGGMQVERTPERIHQSAVTLCERYPELCTLNTKKKSGFSEVRLRDTRTPDILSELPKSKQTTCSQNNNNNNNNHTKKLKIEPLPENLNNINHTNNNNNNHTNNHNNNNHNNNNRNNNNRNNNQPRNNKIKKDIENASRRIIKYLGGNLREPPSMQNVSHIAPQNKNTTENNHFEVTIPSNNQPTITTTFNLNNRANNNRSKKTRKRLRKNYMKKRKITNTRNNMNTENNNQNKQTNNRKHHSIRVNGTKNHNGNNDSNPYNNTNNNETSANTLMHNNNHYSNKNYGTSGNISNQSRNALSNMLETFQSGTYKP